MSSFRLVSRAAAVGAVVAFVSFGPACSDEATETAGKRVVLRTKLEPSAEATTAFTNAQGWSITVTKALLATGPLYYFDGAVILSERTAAPLPSPARRAMRELWGERTAFAHPGHYIPGNARGQMVSPFSVDLRAGVTELPAGEGVTGAVRSATFSFAKSAAGPFASELGAHVAVLEGQATKGAETRVFRAEIDASDVLDPEGAPAVEGCPFQEANIADDGTITVRISIKQWFDQVELDAVPASQDGKPVLIPTSSIAHNELARGMKAGNAYTFQYSR